jgi:predicted MFS family arabinose efflux permease
MAASPKRRAMATATFLSIYDIGIGLGSFLIGMLAAKVSLGTIYLYSSIYVLAGIVLYYLLQGRKLHSKKQHERSEAI